MDTSLFSMLVADKHIQIKQMGISMIDLHELITNKLDINDMRTREKRIEK